MSVEKETSAKTSLAAMFAVVTLGTKRRLMEKPALVSIFLGISTLSIPECMRKSDLGWVTHVNRAFLKCNGTVPLHF